MQLFKKIFVVPAKLVFLKEDLNDIMKIAKSLKESGLLIEGVRGTIENKAKEQKVRFLGMLLGTLDANLLGNILATKNM